MMPAECVVTFLVASRKIWMLLSLYAERRRKATSVRSGIGRGGMKSAAMSGMTICQNTRYISDIFYRSRGFIKSTFRSVSLKFSAKSSSNSVRNTCNLKTFTLILANQQMESQYFNCGCKRHIPLGIYLIHSCALFDLFNVTDRL